MTNRPDYEPREPADVEQQPASIIVPGARAEDPTDNELATELQQARDLGSASRSCMAIIVVLLALALVLCVFLFWAMVIN